MIWKSLSALSLVAILLPAPAFAEQQTSSDTLLRAKLVACPAEKTTIGPVRSCGKIWSLRSGEVILMADGKLQSTVQGLVLNDASVGEANGTPNGVDAVAAAVVCVGNSGSQIAVQTDPVPLNAKGDAKIDAHVTLPQPCIAPVVVLRERYEGNISGWLAANS